MLWPELLYQLSARDAQVTWLEPNLQAVAQAAANASLSATVTVPEPRALVLTHVFANATPGVGQNVVASRIAVFPPVYGAAQSGPEVQLDHVVGPFAADVTAFNSWQGELVLPPGWRILHLCTFNAGVQQNSQRINTTGMLIPVGNIVRV